MSDPETTREEDVTAHIQATEGKWGEENWQKVMITCLKDISISLAKMLDNSAS